MYRKLALYFFMGQAVLLLAWISVSGAAVNKQAVKAFALMDRENEEITITSFWGVVKEVASKERTLDLRVMTRKKVIQITQTEYEDLLRIVEAEAGGEDRRGKMLVANVIINRVEDPRFPDTVSEVIFQEVNGTAQFSPVADGRFYEVVISPETIDAVNHVLMGEDNSKGALYFVARKAADPQLMEWFDENLDPLFAYGGHEFFY